MSRTRADHGGVVRNLARSACGALSIAVLACAPADDADVAVPSPLAPSTHMDDAQMPEAPPAVDAAVSAPVLPLPPLGVTPVVGASVSLATVVGGFRPLMLGSRAIGFYGADLGWTFQHGDDLWVLFGDSWADPWASSLLEVADDALGKISLSLFPDGDAVERWVATHRPATGIPGWISPGPPIRIALDRELRATPIRQLADGLILTSAPGLTPIAGFSNRRHDRTNGAFGVFLRNEPVRCSPEGGCGPGLDCDVQLGRCAPLSDLSAVCVIGTATCTCVAADGPRGFCQDRGSSLYDATSERGRTSAVVMRQQVGNALRGLETIFASQPWDTHRFFNATVGTAEDFDEQRAGGVGNDYTPVSGLAPERDGVFIWGRPGFGGIGRVGRDAQLYLAWVPMPEYDPTGRFRWQPRFFAGLDAVGRPRFVDREVDAVPLDLDATRPGAQPEEPLDIVGQMAITWLPRFQRFAMFYGGDMGDEFLDIIFGPDRSALARDPLGALYVRFAEAPWGPWTPPTTLMVAGNPEQGVIGQYGPGGILHYQGCQEPACAPSEAALFGERGRLYGPSIIEPWTEPRGDGLDLYWHVSTWNPYQVVLMRTRLSAP